MNQYRVYTEDNGRYHLPGVRRLHGIFHSGEEAEQACRALIDNYLLRSYSDSITARELFQQYALFGNDAFIVASRSDVNFSARQYARTRCHQICGAGAPLTQEVAIVV